MWHIDWRNSRLFLLRVILSILLAACTTSDDILDQKNGADMVLTGGNVYTLNWEAPDLDGSTSGAAPFRNGKWQADAQAIAITDGKIVFVGADTDMQTYISNSTEVIDVEGATILPGFIDSHTHIHELGETLSRVNLVGIEHPEDAIDLIVERAKTTPVGEWVVGQGWDEGAWANHYPDMKILSQRIPDHPVLMRSLHGFASWGNQLAFSIAGIDAHTKDPVGGEILHYDSGEPSGILLNNASRLLDDVVPEVSEEELAQQILAGLDQMARDGFVTIHEAGVKSKVMSAMQQLEDEGRLPIRVYAMLSARDEPLSKAWIKRGPDNDADSFLVTRSVKAYYDGALGSRGAKMLEDYSDRPGHRGVSGDDYGFDQDLVEDLMESGFQIGVHAIGDAGNRETLDFFDGVFNRHAATRGNRHRIEHAQILHPDDLKRFAAMNIIASMEPPHAVEDKSWAEDRIGHERIKGAYAWQSLRRSGAIVIFNSDNPGSDHNLFYGLHSAVTRQDKSYQPEGGWYPGEAFTIEEAIRAYTSVPAFAAFREDQTGIIEAGRWADITILDIDPFNVAQQDPAGLLDGSVVMTIVAGKLVSP